jgi:hypothetical protein
MGDRVVMTSETNFSNVVIGDSKTLTVSGVAIDAEYGGDLLTPGRVAWCTIKRYPDDADPGLYQLSSDDDPSVIVDATTLAFPIASAVSKLFPQTRVHYDVMLDLGDGRSVPIAVGTIDMEGEVTAAG